MWKIGQGAAWTATVLGSAGVTRPLDGGMSMSGEMDGQVLSLFPSPDKRYVGVVRAGQDWADLSLKSFDSGQSVQTVKAPADVFNAKAVDFQGNDIFIVWGAREGYGMGVGDFGDITLDHLPSGPDGMLNAGKGLRAFLTSFGNMDVPFQPAAESR